MKRRGNGPHHPWLLLGLYLFMPFYVLSLGQESPPLPSLCLLISSSSIFTSLFSKELLLASSSHASFTLACISNPTVYHSPSHKVRVPALKSRLQASKGFSVVQRLDSILFKGREGRRKKEGVEGGRRKGGRKKERGARKRKKGASNPGLLGQVT